MASSPITLPHPHGSAPGQIAHNSQYATDDTPGSTGGRFVGFGEAGTSRVANRAVWALSENMDRIFTDILSMPISINAGLAFTSSGSNRIQIADAQVFCGDASYPGSASPADPEGMRALFTVLDSQYNPLFDTSGNEVRAYSVYDSADATLVYKTGYVLSPWVHFCTADPATGAIINPNYSIPAATAVRLVYGVRGNLKDLPYDHPDAFTRFRALTGEDVPVGVVLQDGSRPMLGTLNLNAHGITGVYSIERDTSTGILRINSPIRNEPHTGVDPFISCRYTPTGAETGAAYHGGVEWLLSDRAYTGVSLVMSVDPSAANAKPALLISVSSQGYAAASILFSAEANTLRPWSTPIDLGAWNRVWKDAYLTSIWGPVGPDSTLPVIVGSGFSSENDSTSLNLVGPVALYRSVGGSAPSLYMEYFAADAQPAGEQVLGTVSLSDWGWTNQAIMSLSGDPIDPSGASTTLSWTVVNGSFGTRGMVLRSSVSFPALSPLSDLGLGLGTFGNRWSNCFLDNVISRVTTVGTCRDLHLQEGGTIVLLSRGADFNFFSDFGNRLLTVTTSESPPGSGSYVGSIDENFILLGSTGLAFSLAGESVYGHTTVMSLTAEDAVSATALISGPILNRIATNKISMTTCFALQFLSGGGNPGYIFRMGIGSNANPDLGSTHFQVIVLPDTHRFYLDWDDGVGTAGGIATDSIATAETFYTLEIRFEGDGYVRVYLNDTNIVPSGTGPVDNPGVAFTPGNGDYYPCPACIDTTTGGTRTSVVIDWIDIHSEGHCR